MLILKEEKFSTKYLLQLFFWCTYCPNTRTCTCVYTNTHSLGTSTVDSRTEWSTVSRSPFSTHGCFLSGLKLDPFLQKCLQTLSGCLSIFLTGIWQHSGPDLWKLTPADIWDGIQIVFNMYLEIIVKIIIDRLIWWRFSQGLWWVILVASMIRNGINWKTSLSAHSYENSPGYLTWEDL